MSEQNLRQRRPLHNFGRNVARGAAISYVVCAIVGLWVNGWPMLDVASLLLLCGGLCWQMARTWPGTERRPWKLERMPGLVRLVSWLLMHANRHGGGLYTRDFYALKDRLLRRFGSPDGADVQHIVDACYGWGWEGCTGDQDCKCGGSGVFRERWILLERWAIGGRVFHRPVGPTPARVATIEGIIEHHGGSYRASAEARLWLALCFEPRVFWRRLAASRFERPWGFPLLMLQWVVFTLRDQWARHRPRRHRCWRCERAFWSLLGGGSYWRPCRRCEAAIATTDEELPF